MEDILRDGFRELGLAAEPRTIEAFRLYYDLLAERSAVMNLTAIHGEEDTARLHFLDSCALLTLESFAGRSVIDVGTGAGFPGLPLKLAQPDISLTLLDSLQKRVGFLREVSERIGLGDIRFIEARAEEAPPETRGAYDIAVSRAVARLNVLCEICMPFVKTGGCFIAMKGPDCADELDEAQNAISLLGGDAPRVAEYTVPGADVKHCAVIIRKTADTPSGYPRRWARIAKRPL